MSDHRQKIRIVITENSYRMANRIRHVLILAEYNRDNIFEAIEVDELLKSLYNASSPMHIVTLTPSIVSELERQELHEVLDTEFPDLALLLISFQNESGKHSRIKIIPDYVLTPPFSAESMEIAITTALMNRKNRKLIVEHITRGQNAIKDGLLKEAQTSFEAAVKLGGPDPYPCYVLGDLYATLGDNEQAISLKNSNRSIPYLEKASEKHIAPVESLIQLGTWYCQNDADEQARVKFRLATNMESSRTLSAIQEHIQSIVERGEIDAAIKLLQIGLDVLPDNPHLYGLLGDLLVQQNRHKEALFYYNSLIHADHPLPADHCRLAREYLALGFDLRAEMAIKAALNLDPECVEAEQLRSSVLTSSP
jgi:tetratricopeptide (TPR) repeat protein